MTESLSLFNFRYFLDSFSLLILVAAQLSPEGNKEKKNLTTILNLSSILPSKFLTAYTLFFSIAYIIPRCLYIFVICFQPFCCLLECKLQACRDLLILLKTSSASRRAHKDSKYLMGIFCPNYNLLVTGEKIVIHRLYINYLKLHRM